MNTPPTAPSPGKPVSAGFFSRLIGWIRSGQLVEGQGYKLHRTPNGTSIELKDKKVSRANDSLHPWKVFAVGKSDNVDHLFEIYIPEGVLHIGEESVEIEEISAVSGKDNRFTLDFEDDIGDDNVVYLVITRDDGGFKARLSLESDSEEEEEDIFTILPIAKLSTDDSGDYPIGKVNSQYAHSSICLSGDGSSSSPSPSPFQYTVTESEDPETGEMVKQGAIENRTFYWDGVLTTVDDFDPPDTGTVYLTCTQSEPSEGNPDPYWEFELADAPAEADEGGRAVNYKLYDIEDYVVTMDYRTTFLEFNSPHKVAKFVVEKPSGDSSVTLDASGDDKASATVESSSKKIVLDTSDLQSGDEAKLHKLTIKKTEEGSTVTYEYDILSTEDITIDLTGSGGGGGELPDLDVLKDVAIEYDSSTHQMSYQKTTVNLSTQEETVIPAEEVFTAAPHYGNETPPSSVSGMNFAQ